MGYDWRDQTRKDVLHFAMVSPNNIDQSFGELQGVELSGSSLTAGYFTDTRTSGKLRVVNSNWVRGSLIRVTHEVPAWGFRRELGTYIVTADPAERDCGEWVTDLTLNSRLYGLSTEKHPYPWTIAAGASCLAAMDDSLRCSRAPFVIRDANDIRFGAAKVVESGTARLAALFDLGNASGNRLDVDPHGRVTLSRRMDPGAKVPLFRIDLNDPRGVMTGGLSLETDWLGMADAVAVSHKYSERVGSSSEQREIAALATMGDHVHHSHAQRGYRVTNYISLSDMEPKTYERAMQIANDELQKEQRELIEWQLSTTYLPLWEGDAVELYVHDGPYQYRGLRRCFVKSLDLELEHMTMRMTLKEVASGDKGDEDK